MIESAIDGSAIAFAMVLALSAALAAILARRAKGGAKTYIDFASALFAALAVAQTLAGVTALSVAPIALIVLALAPTALMLAAVSAFTTKVGPAFAGVILGLSGIAGMSAALTAQPVFALLPLAANVFVLLAIGALQLRTRSREVALLIASALSLAVGTAAFLNGGTRVLMLFAAASLLGIALALNPRSGARAEQKRGGWMRRSLPVRSKR